jgi:hypothetical protein
MNWYPDIGCTNHLTNELSNLNILVDEYRGPNQICINNGQGLVILHTGLAFLSTLNRVFHLPHLLHVPQIQKKSHLY